MGVKYRDTIHFSKSETYFGLLASTTLVPQAFNEGVS
jgi:hypothetical protein